MIAEGNWTGWLFDRKKKLWQKVCDADSLGACARQLGQLARQRGILDKNTCLTRGGAPSWTPPAS
jgi:hypothetical protein